jgi:hypothetical protein
VRAFALALKKEAAIARHRQLDILLLNAGFAAGKHDGRPLTDAQVRVRVWPGLKVRQP